MNYEHADTEGKVDSPSSGFDTGGQEGKRKNPFNWQNLSSKQKGRFIVQGVIQFALLLWTLWDLRHRAADKVKGSKRFWTLFAFVQPIGPISYLLFGRKK